MRAHKITVAVPESGHIELDLPSDFRGGDAEVIVLASPLKRPEPNPGALPRGSWERLRTVLAAFHGADRLRMTAREVDAYLAEERASWGDDP